MCLRRVIGQTVSQTTLGLVFPRTLVKKRNAREEVHEANMRVGVLHMHVHTRSRPFSPFSSRFIPLIAASNFCRPQSRSASLNPCYLIVLRLGHSSRPPHHNSKPEKCSGRWATHRVHVIRQPIHLSGSCQDACPCPAPSHSALDRRVWVVAQCPIIDKCYLIARAVESVQPDHQGHLILGPWVAHIREPVDG